MREHDRSIFPRRAVMIFSAALLMALQPLPLRGATGDPWKGTVKTQADPQAVQTVAAGARDMASAAWWGFNPEDSTEALQAAIDSKAKTIVIPNMGKPWIVRPIKLRSNLTLILEDGTEIEAKKGEFKAPNACLFNAPELQNLIIKGAGPASIVRMHKEDYTHAPYTKGEWRMGINLIGCSNVTIENLTVASTGGDGIYVGAGEKQNYCKDVTIRTVTCKDNYRQGISVISAKGLLIEDCLLQGTAGTAPAAGIDLEPNRADERLENVVIRRCTSQDNQGWGYLISIPKLDDPNGAPISVRFEDCRVNGTKGFGLGIVGATPASKGKIVFADCGISNTGRAGFLFFCKGAAGVPVLLQNCTFRNVATNPPGQGPNPEMAAAPLVLYPRYPKIVPVSGGIAFDHCTIEDDRDRPVLLWADKDKHLPVANISGTITVKDSAQPTVDLGSDQKNVHLVLKSAGKD
jgi:parallel beta-helix repeat protein